MITSKINLIKCATAFSQCKGAKGPRASQNSIECIRPFSQANGAEGPGATHLKKLI